MVRYDKCVEALYDRGLIEDKNKSLQMLKVMKGAISMSKSKTGECIFRTNKLEKKNLERLVKVDKRNSLYNIARVDTSKKTIVGRWMKMLDKQTTCSSQTLLEEALYIKEPNSNSFDTEFVTDLSPRQTDDDGKLRKYLDLRLARDETAPFLKQRRAEADPNLGSQHEGKNETDDDGFVTERKDMRDKYTSETGQKTEQNATERNVRKKSLAKIGPILLPNVNSSGFKHPQAIQQNTIVEEQSPRALERDLTNWKDWRLRDKNWILSYIRKEKTRHDDLILRNALVKIETDMSGANSIRRHQIRQKLQVERDEEIKREREQTSEALVVCDKNRAKSVTFENTPKLELKKSQTEVLYTSPTPPESKLLREESVSFAKNVSFKAKSSRVSRPKVCREKTINIVYKEPGERTCVFSPSGSDTRRRTPSSPRSKTPPSARSKTPPSPRSKTPPSPRSNARRRESTLSVKLSDSKLPVICEAQTVVSPVGSK